MAAEEFRTVGHPQIENRTPFAFETLFLMDEEGRPLLVPLVQATWVVDGRSRPVVPEKQLPVRPAGQYWGDPDTSSCKYEPQTAFLKPTTDVVLIGHAYPARAGDREVLVTLRVGTLEKTVRVVGDRCWIKTLGIINIPNPQPFERIPLIYERAFGGWDTAGPDPVNGQFEPRNPVGVGFRRKKYEEGLKLPNLEDPRRPLRSWGDTPPPAGFGFLAPHWQPRAKYAGTYDKAWQENRAPLLPTDFDPRFFNAASPGLIAPEYLKGNESVSVEHATPGGRLAFTLPGVPAPQIHIQLRGREDVHLPTNLDTVIINTDENLLLMLWRTNLVLRSGPHDVVAIRVSTTNRPLAVGT